jgi:hypothetical protein
MDSARRQPQKLVTAATQPDRPVRAGSFCHPGSNNLAGRICAQRSISVVVLEGTIEKRSSRKLAKRKKRTGAGVPSRLIDYLTTKVFSKSRRTLPLTPSCRQRILLNHIFQYLAYKKTL